MASRRLQDNYIEIILKCDNDDEGEETEQEEENQMQEVRLSSSSSPSPQQPPTSHWELPSQVGYTRGVHNFRGGSNGMKHSEAPHKNRNSSPLCVSMLFFSRSYQTAGGGDKPILSPKPRHS
jgi:hypothetical protein